MDIVTVLVTTMKSDLQHELLEVDRFERCETKAQIISILDDIVRDMDFLTKKYQDMLARLKISE